MMTDPDGIWGQDYEAQGEYWQASNLDLRTRTASPRKFLLQKSVFLGFNDYQDGIWGQDYEAQGEYWQASYEWGRQIACFADAKGINITWKNINVIPRSLTGASISAHMRGYVLV
jgi:hypothetical protein|tara:strand:- start:4992 stop:5336 length:345 start_codon:yes stop_codon:yes gene_type:complete